MPFGRTTSRRSQAPTYPSHLQASRVIQLLHLGQALSVYSLGFWVGHRLSLGVCPVTSLSWPPGPQAALSLHACDP